jgi:hypothetical protein
MSVPKQAGKTTLVQLNELNSFALKQCECIEGGIQGLYQKRIMGFQFDYLYQPSIHKRLFVFFSGSAQRSKINPPVFQRWSWAHLFPGHCLYVSDPSLFLNDKLGLAWYSGTSGFDPMPIIAQEVKNLALSLDINESSIFSYGSSGGGFAALRSS